MRIIFPYMARWRAFNWSRYHHIFSRLARWGHEVHVIQPPRAGLKETNFTEIEVPLPKNIFLYEVDIPGYLWRPSLPLNKVWKKGMYCLYSVDFVRALAKKIHPDVMVVYNIPQFPLLKGRTSPVVFDCCDDYLAMLRHELGPLSCKPLLKVAASILGKMCVRADLTLAVSESLGRKLSGSVQILPNGADLSMARVTHQGTPSRLFEGPVVGFVGSFEYFVDFDLVLETARLMPGVTFLLAGTGRHFNEVREKVRRGKLVNVVLPGGLPYNHVSRYISTMDVCLVPFSQDDISHNACPIKLFEYAALGKPVISTSLEEVSRIGKEFVFFADRPRELVETIEMVLGGGDEVRRKIAVGLKLVEGKYNWDNIAREFLHYLEVL